MEQYRTFRGKESTGKRKEAGLHRACGEDLELQRERIRDVIAAGEEEGDEENTLFSPTWYPLTNIFYFASTAPWSTWAAAQVLQGAVEAK